MPPSLSRKIAECLLVALAIFNTYQTVIFFRLTYLPGMALQVQVYKYLMPALAVLCILFALIFPFWWQRRAAIGVTWHRTTVAIIRYWLALCIAGYGFGKLFGLQFGHSFIRNDTIVSQLSGFELTWFYFGHSFTFTVLISLLQIGGCILLLYRRTTLAGVILLLPVMVNILLIDLFYQIPLPATLNALYYTGGLCYLFLLRWPEVWAVIGKQDHWPPRKTILKNMARLLIIGSALLFSWYVSKPLFEPNYFAGKWTITHMERNHSSVKADAWLHDRDAWKTVYIERYQRISFSPNPYIFEKARATNGNYQVDAATQALSITLLGSTKQYTSVVTEKRADNFLWELRSGTDTVRMWLQRKESGR